MDFGGGDIAAAIRICADIYRYGISADNRADVRYANFRSDINNFDSLLQTLHETLHKAHQRYETRLNLHNHRRALDPLAADFERERVAVVGNFSATLDECKTFVESKEKYKTKRSNLVENLGWHLLQDEQRVNDLRQRITFHALKIRFVISRLSIDVLSDLDAKSDDVLALAEENLSVNNATRSELGKFRTELFGYLAGQTTLPMSMVEDRHVATLAIRQRFQDSLANRPTEVSSVDLPLSEWFDALVHALEQSNEGNDQTPENYLAFLKTRWLVNIVQSTTAYKDARPGFYLKRAFHQIDKALQARIQSPDDLIRFEETHLLALSAEHFAVWKPTIESVSTGIDLQLDRPQGDENEVAKIRLATMIPGCTDTLTLLKRSDVQFRAVREIVLSSSCKQLHGPLQIDVREDHLVPRYLLPTLDQACLEMSLFIRGAENSYPFQSIEDLYILQSALIGYEISHDQSSISCRFSKTAQHLDCDSARIQLWQEPLESQDGDQSASSTEQGSACVRSGSRTGTHSSIAATTTVVQTGDGYEAQAIKHCAITLFSKHMKTRNQQQLFNIVFIPLTEDSRIDERGCACHRGYDDCLKLVLVRSNAKPIAIRFRYCDLHSFDLLEFRTRSGFKQASVAQTEHIVFKFNTLAEKIKFHNELRLRFAVREAQLADQRKFGERFRQRQDRPQTVVQDAQQHERRKSSNLAVRSPANLLPPRLPAVDSGPAFSPNLESSPPRMSVSNGTPVRSNRLDNNHAHGGIEMQSPLTSDAVGGSSKWIETTVTSHTPRRQQTGSSTSTVAPRKAGKSRSIYRKMFKDG